MTLAFRRAFAAAVAVLLVCPPAARVQHVHQAMDKVVIPPGAPSAEADMRFMQGMIAHVQTAEIGTMREMLSQTPAR